MTTSSSPTATLFDEIALFGVRPGSDEPDHRPLPEAETVELAIGQMIEATAMLVTETRLEEDLTELLWSQVNIFHRRLIHVERLLDDNEAGQRQS